MNIVAVDIDVDHQIIQPFKKLNVSHNCGKFKIDDMRCSPAVVFNETCRQDKLKLHRCVSS